MQSYYLDEKAQKLVLTTIDNLLNCKKDSKYINQVIGEVFDMRSTIAYGLERFWGEHIRFFQKDGVDKDKGEYWKETWDEFAKIMKEAGIEDLPESLSAQDIKKNDLDVQTEVNKLWKKNAEERQILLSILTQFCDCMIWWTQRLKSRIKG
ncbi:MAG: hypothetical protein HC835_21965 [Oscillatoriales cyanobacterium RM2_1_1]|nr:hypothetical protein [Oscillatoriales cyanobacterium RM2_1_1]